MKKRMYEYINIVKWKTVIKQTEFLFADMAGLDGFLTVAGTSIAR